MGSVFLRDKRSWWRPGETKEMMTMTALGLQRKRNQEMKWIQLTEMKEKTESKAGMKSQLRRLFSRIFSLEAFLFPLCFSWRKKRTRQGFDPLLRSDLKWEKCVGRDADRSIAKGYKKNKTKKNERRDRKEWKAQDLRCDFSSLFHHDKKIRLRGEKKQLTIVSLPDDFDDGKRTVKGQLKGKKGNRDRERQERRETNRIHMPFTKQETQQNERHFSNEWEEEEEGHRETVNEEEDGTSAFYWTSHLLTSFYFLPPLPLEQRLSNKHSNYTVHVNRVASTNLFFSLYHSFLSRRQRD